MRTCFVFEGDVLDATGAEFLVNQDEGKIGYLRDLRSYYDVRTWQYERQEQLERLLARYALGLLEDAQPADRGNDPPNP